MSTQPLPVLTEEQLNVAGPVQPAGKALNPVIDKAVAGRPSSVVNVTATVICPPTTTAIGPAGEGVATTLLLLVAV